MAFTWELSSERHDLVIKNGKLQVVTGPEEIKQRILVALWHYWTEYFLNVPAGVPWYELILGSKDKKIAESILRRAVLGVPGVISIIRFRLQAPIGGLRDFAIFIDIEVNGAVISILTTAPATNQTTNYLTTEHDIFLTTDSNIYLST